MICIDKGEGMIYPGNNKYLSEYLKMPPSVMCLSLVVKMKQMHSGLAKKSHVFSC